MGNGGDTLHFDGVHLFQRMIENTRSVNGLESQIFVIKMTDEQTLGSEGVGLDINIGTGNASQETRLANIGISTDEEGSSVGVDGRQTTKMLTHLIQIHEGIIKSLDDGGHTTQRGLLQLLALEQRLAIFE